MTTTSSVSGPVKQTCGGKADEAAREDPMQPSTNHAGSEALDALLVLDPIEIAQLPWQAVPGCPGVREKELWRFGDFVHALIRYEPGSSTPGRPHLAAHHHIWTVSGNATIGGRPLVTGSYVHVPPGVEHPVRDVGPDGCTLLQVHRPLS